MTSLLEVRDVVVRYGEVEAVSNVSLAVSEGEAIAVLGRNGAGKSSLLKGLSGAVKLAAGGVMLEGKDLSPLGPRQIARAGVAYVPEGRRIFPGLNVRDNLILGTSNRGSVGRRERKNLLDGVFEVFPELEEKQDAPGWTLSGGQQQMVAIGRALMAKPRLLLVDEPSLGLAPVTAVRMLESLERVKGAGVTIVLVEQNVNVALKVVGRGYVLELGTVVVTGTSNELAENETVIRAYLGGDLGKTRGREVSDVE